MGIGLSTASGSPPGMASEGPMSLTLSSLPHYAHGPAVVVSPPAALAAGSPSPTSSDSEVLLVARHRPWWHVFLLNLISPAADGRSRALEAH
ncbi:hypothetical protein EVG20_g2264 [Dentipellis fragilis]|uniref:Uncharacterized protein n=1 Tax=Dentipellis fragilis TaxID=205917 RepID=A0A4Y9Z8G2_9AGAM|nr:hypothetical protein EVG20_g2264 [Dentipellis fragilis]